MTFSSQLQEATGSSDGLVEASLGRVWQHHQKTGFAIVTAWRGDQDKRTNEAALKSLKADVRGAGYGFVPLEGVGQEKVDGKIVEAAEPSLLIPNSRRDAKEDRDDLSEREQSSTSELRKLALKWGKKYNQWAVIIHDPETGTEIVHPDGTVDSHMKKFSPNTVARWFSRLKGKAFTLEWWGIKYPEPPSGWMEGTARQVAGQVSIAECSDRLADWLAEMGLR